MNPFKRKNQNQVVGRKKNAQPVEVDGHDDLPHGVDKIYYVLTGLLGILLLVISAPGGVTSLLTKEAWLHLARELGFAFIVSVLLVLTIEKFTRQRHEIAAKRTLEQINKNLFQAIYHRSIPPQIFAEVEKSLLRSNVFREKHVINYSFDDLDLLKHGLPAATDDRRKHLECKVQSEYVLRNLTGTSIQHEIKMLVELPIDHRLDRLCKIDRVIIEGEELSRHVIDECSHKTAEHLIFSHKVHIPAGESVQVITNATLIKQAVDSEIWVSRIPSYGLTLNVSMPNRNIDIFAYAHHSEELYLSYADGVRKTWVLDHGIFPHQSVVFWWKPK